MMGSRFPHHAAATALVVAILAGGVEAGTATAQGIGPLTATGTQGMTFGTIIAGVPASISRTDALNAGQFEIRGQGGAQVRVDFTLPASMVHIPGGATMPLVFGATDAGQAPNPVITTAIAFDPRASLSTTLSGSGRLYLYLGGTARPTVRQTPGAYSATITVTVSYVN